MLWLSVLIVISLNHLQAIDFNFRFKDGYCQKNGKPGYNPSEWGECGNLARSQVRAQKEQDLNLLGSNLNSSLLYMADYNGGEWSHVSLRRSVIIQSQWRDLTANNMDLRGSHIKGSRFEKVDLKNSLAQAVRLVKVAFIDCDLQNINLWGANLQEVDFSDSDLRGANLENTFLLFTRFDRAKYNQKTRLPFSEDEAIQRGMLKVD
jgi:uncharacterized protein YjbI with pentapeptide repeats